MEGTNINPDLFFFIQSSLDTDVHKPDAGVFLPSIEKLNTKNIIKEEIIYVGDAIDDYVASNNAGLHFYGIANRTVKESEFITQNIPYITNIKILPDFINDLDKG